MFSLFLMQKLLNIKDGGLIFNRIEPKQVTVNTSSSFHTLSKPRGKLENTTLAAAEEANISDPLEISAGS